MFGGRAAITLCLHVEMEKEQTLFPLRGFWFASIYFTPFPACAVPVGFSFASLQYAELLHMHAHSLTVPGSLASSFYWWGFLVYQRIVKVFVML